MKKIGLMTLLVFLTNTMSMGQVFSLKQCIQYALSNNSSIKIGHFEETIAQQKVHEQIGVMLPQISASGSMDDNLKVATQLMPGTMFGKPGTFVPVQMGTKYNVSAGVQVNQELYDQTFWVAMKAAGISKKQSSRNLQKTTEQTIYSTVRTYYQTLVIGKQYNALKATLDPSAELLKATELKLANGLAKKLDVDKLRVSYNTASSQLQQTQLSYNQSLNNLKYQMGMPMDSAIVLDDPAIEPDTNAIETSSMNNDLVENRVDFQLQKINLQLQETDRSRIMAMYLPSLSFNAKYNYQAMPEDFKSGLDWYESSSIGLSLSIPIFDGLQKSAKLAQSKMSIEKARENIKMIGQSIMLDISNYQIQYRNAVDNMVNEKANLALAHDVYENTKLEYREGSSMSLDLVQAESSYREAQNNYFNKLLTLYIARLDLEQSKGTLLSFVEH